MFTQGSLISFYDVLPEVPAIIIIITLADARYPFTHWEDSAKCGLPMEFEPSTLGLRVK